MGKPLINPKVPSAMEILQNGLPSPLMQIDFCVHEAVIRTMMTAKGTPREPVVIRFWNELLSEQDRAFYMDALVKLPGSEKADFLVMVSPSSRRLPKPEAAAA